MIEGLPPDLGYTDYDTRLAAYAVVVEDRRILLAWWNGEGVAEPCWTLPGGGVDLAETPEEGAVREVLEETGHHVVLTGLLTVHSLAIRPERRTASTARWLRAVRAVYAAEVTGGTLGTVEVGGHHRPRGLGRPRRAAPACPTPTSSPSASRPTTPGTRGADPASESRRPAGPAPQRARRSRPGRRRPRPRRRGRRGTTR